MLETIFKGAISRQRLRSGPAALYLDKFAARLNDEGYSVSVAQSHLCTADRFAKWANKKGLEVRELDEGACEAFCRHSRRRNRSSDGLLASGARRFVAFLRSTGVSTSTGESSPDRPESPLFRQFRRWMRYHRGAFESTVDSYGRTILELLERLGDDPRKFGARELRQFVLDLSGRHGIAYAKRVVTAVRMFVRFLVAVGKCPVGLEHAIPTIAEWRLSTLPKYLQPEEVEKIIASCDPSTPLGARDQAVILLMARLGLRAGDVAGLKLSDFNWEDATMVVSGKNRRGTRLPLPSDVGSAVIHYVEKHRPSVESDRLFICIRAPLGPISRHVVSATARRAIQRAGIQAPSYGGHVFRHSAATGMLRQGASLQCIGAVLRHESIETTAHYAKVDVDLLKEVVMPWPEVERC